MAILNPTLILPQLIGQEEMQFDMAKFNWIGSLQSVNVACMIRKEAGIKHLADILGSDKQVLRFGATGAGASKFTGGVPEGYRCTDKGRYGLCWGRSDLPCYSTRRGRRRVLHMGRNEDYRQIATSDWN